VFRWLRRRRESEPDVDPAAELRAKLEESRSVADERDEFEAGETPVDQADPDASTQVAPPPVDEASAEVAPPPVDEADPEARRRAVHEQARARIDELSGRDEG
jgi:hypothetical protein